MAFNLRYNEFKKKYFDFYDEDRAVLYTCSYLLSDVDEESLTCEASFENNILEEEVRYKSEFFSMRKVCERACVNYSTFRGFKNNKQYFSAEKLLKLLDTMKAISGESWNDEIQAAVESL